MSFINLHELIKIVPDLINLFLPGYVFILVYGWMKAKKYDVSILIVSSLFLSYTISIFYTVVHDIILSDYNFNEALKSLIYISSGLIFSLIIVFLQNTKVFKKILRKLNHKALHDDIFDNILDYNNKTILQIYMKNSPVLYIGSFKVREEKGIDSYISLIEHIAIDSKTKETVFDPEENGLNSSVIINLRDVERIEVIYEKDSDLWNYLIN